MSNTQIILHSYINTTANSPTFILIKIFQRKGIKIAFTYSIQQNFIFFVFFGIQHVVAKKKKEEK